jgi:hypothetical protein
LFNRERSDLPPNTYNSHEVIPKASPKLNDHSFGTRNPLIIATEISVTQTANNQGNNSTIVIFRSE